MTAIIPSREAAPAITNVITLPLYFLSGVFIPENEIPEDVLSFAGLFPVRNFFEALFAAYSPASSAAGVEWQSMLFVGLWGVAGLLLALRFFRWTPRS